MPRRMSVYRCAGSNVCLPYNGEGGKPAKKPRGNTAVFVSHLPESTTVSQLSETGQLDAGLLQVDDERLALEVAVLVAVQFDLGFAGRLEDAAGEPKIKLYRDENGHFKGEALIVYLQEARDQLEPPNRRPISCCCCCCPIGRP
jgi:HIV Tat-specific factor 1